MFELPKKMLVMLCLEGKLIECITIRDMLFGSGLSLKFGDSKKAISSIL